MYSIVRDRQRVWPYCTVCGCRLNVMFDDDGEGKTTLSHFPAHWHTDEDARGHKCANINEYISLNSLDDIFIGE